MMDKSILEAVHDSAKDLYQTGVMDEITMRDFDALCLPPVGQYNLEQIRCIQHEKQGKEAPTTERR